MPTAPAASYKEAQPGNEQAQANGWRMANPQDEMLRGKWWEIFGDPQLNALEEKLVINNQNIKQYFENYMAARALVQNARSSLFPTLSLAPTYSAQGAGPSSTATLSSSTSSRSYLLPLSVSWEPDLFGKVRNTIREEANAAQLSAANLANETLSEQASLAEYYFELRGEDALADLYDKTTASYKESLRLTQTLSNTGIDTDQDVAEAESNLRSAEANAVAVRTTRAQYEHAIALLIGESASSFSLAPMPLEVKVPYVPTGVPSQLLERRPDIAAAERTMAEMNALIGVGKAAYFPSLSLSAEGGTQSSDVTKLLNYGARYWSLGGSISETLLDFGARRATVRNYEAQYNASVANYRQTVLSAFKEVEDYLVANRQLAEQTGREKLAVDAAQRYERLATTRYRTGIDTYLNVLTAQNSLFSAQQTMVSLETNQMTSAVHLIAALGGGWNATDLPGEKQVASRP
jgi:NodT family efflux transporter outer membrane factor (OMF) lipoprotein